jgi:hypothetical protein
MRVNSCWKGSRNFPLENADASALGYLIHFVRAAHKMVEAAGIEPASVSPRPSALHAYSVYYLTPHWPNEKGLRGELALSLIASATSRARQLSHESRTRFEYMGISAPGQALT